MSVREVRLEPSVTLRVGSVLLTERQLQVIQAIHEEGSQNRAARRLGVSPPVLHRYLAQIEAKVGARLVQATPRGTKLNEEGERIALEYRALTRRMAPSTKLVVGGTIVTEELLLRALSRADPQGECGLIISDDRWNLEDFQAGLMDIIVLDDPLFLFDLEGVHWQEVATDRLLHVNKGPRYARFLYGAQRIGFRHLETQGIEHRIERTFRSPEMLIRSDLSFFLNESLALRRGIKLRSDTDPGFLAHQINAVYRKGTPAVRRIVAEIRRAGRKV
ncbi:MAG: LysR family transcriptional regulator [Methanomassiliicoccus sp.]|nr:LysR family transcriptional regulator [Methanomassiliicoccus sp.]